VNEIRGFTLIEAVAALALIAVVVVSVSTALVTSRAVAVRARDHTIGVIAARARLSTLDALAFETAMDAGGAVVSVTDTTTDVTVDPPAGGGTGLGESPADALWSDRPGYVDYLDATGRALGTRASDRASAAYVRRWAIGRQGSGPGELATIAVLVAPATVAARAAADGDPTRVRNEPGVVVLRGARVRQAS
jgi:prepilin-type N-terminal cleavage/methylation domain-containing protein